MKYFPIFLKMDKIRVLVVGGGNIALEKLEKIVDFTCDIEVISKEIKNETLTFLNEHNLFWQSRGYVKNDVDKFDLIVVAVDDLGLQKEIFDECTQKNKLCNSVDSVDFCNFIFPAYIKRGPMCVAISTSGKSPAVAKHLKAYLAQKIPQDIDEFLEYINELRNSLPKGKERMKYLSDVAKNYFEKLEQ